VRDFKLVVVFGFDLQDEILTREADCEGAGLYLRLCSVTGENGTLTAFYYGNDRVPVESPPGIGNWRWAALSPDGRTILAQWAGDCPQAYFADRGDGGLRPVSDFSAALGWTTEGDAIVYVPSDGPCTGRRPGVYFASPNGEKFELQIPDDGQGLGLEPRVEPRTLEQFKREAG
jgi:hypothetical protein